MSEGPGKKTAPAQSPGAHMDPDERRRHRRVDMTLKARVLKPDNVEEPCLVVNMSAGGALLKAVNPPQAGERVVLYIDEMGRFEGLVIRSARHFFAVDYKSRRIKTHRTADNLTYAVNNKHMRIDRRDAPRIRHEQPTCVTLENGESLVCEILDISLTGASIAVDPIPDLGAVLTVGRMTGKVVRRHDRGVGIVFTGAAERMEDVIENTKSAETAPTFGAQIATPFGKKGNNG